MNQQKVDDISQYPCTLTIDEYLAAYVTRNHHSTQY